MNPLSKPLYFFHIPKTAGTSVKGWLENWYLVDDILLCDHLPELKHFATQKDLNQYLLFRGHFGFELQHFLAEQPSIITFLRDPIARALSDYRYIQAQKDELIRVATQLGRQSLVDYYNHVSQLSTLEFFQSDLYLGYQDNLQVRQLAGQSPIEYCYQECDRQMLEQAKENLFKFFYFGISEWMDASIALLSFRLELPFHPLNLFLNRSSCSSDPLAGLSQAEIDIVYQTNQYDCELYELAQKEFFDRFQDMWKMEIHTIDMSIEPESKHQCIQQLPLQPDNFLHVYQKLSDQVSTLLEYNFQLTHANALRLSYVHFDFSELVYLSGWHRRYFDNVFQSWVRWSGPTTASTVYVPLKVNQNYRITFNVLDYATEVVLKSLHLQIQDKIIQLEYVRVEHLSKPTIHIFTGLIPTELIQANVPYTKIAFHVAEVAKFKSVNAGSKGRLLGFLTDGLHIQPINDIPTPACVLMQLNKQPQSLREIKKKSEMLKKKVENLQKQLQDVQAENTWMKSSKFWKLREKWMHVKQILHREEL